MMKRGWRIHSILACWIAIVQVACQKEADILEGQSGNYICFHLSSHQGTEPSRSYESDSSTFLLSCQSTDATFSVSVLEKEQSPFSALASRGTQVTSSASLTEFDVAAYYYNEGSTTAEHFFTETVTDGVNTSQSVHYWPLKGNLDFLAIAPRGLAGTLPTVESYNNNNAGFSYAVPADVSQHQDVMAAVSVGLNHNASGLPVPLNFKHLLASVRFVVGTMQFIQIDALRIENVYGGTVTFTYDKANQQWIPGTLTTLTSYSPAFRETSGLPQGEEIAGNVNNATLFMIPQTLPDEAQIYVEYTALLTGVKESGVVNIAGQKWEAGKDYAYTFNIGTEFDVTIPTPSDQDAHYIMVEMPYQLGALSTYVSSIKATASFLDDGTDTSTKSGISLKFKEDLSETQKYGLWTDAQYVENVTIDSSNGEETSSGVAWEADIRGAEELSIPMNKLSGSIVLFVEENNGITDRHGLLEFKATLKNGSEVVIGQGNFKQLCPSWNSDGVGVERIESAGAVYPYGFNYNRKVTYRTAGWVSISAILSWILESSISNTVTADGNFVTFNYGKVGLFQWTALTSIDIDYSALNAIQSVASNDSGADNTKALYNFTGNINISQIEETLNSNDYLTRSSVSGSTDVPEDYAAFIALARNRMYELKRIVTGSGTTETTYKAILYKENNEDIIEWYLPSSVEARKLVETGTEADGISPLNGTYWSSTAGDDANGYAHSYVFINNVFNGVNENSLRMSENKVRAVRKKP